MIPVRDNKSGLKPRRISSLTKLYETVNDPSTDSIISWNENGTSFIVWKQDEFAKDLLPIIFPTYYRNIIFYSFTRTLISFGFRKVECERCEFADDDFVRGEPKRVRNIYKRRDEAGERDNTHRHRFMLRRKIMKRTMNLKIDMEAADLLEGLHICLVKIDEEAADLLEGLHI